MARILVVDDEEGVRRILAANLSDENHEVIEAPGVAEARRVFAEDGLDAVITDQQMLDGSGMDVLAVARESDPALSVVFLTAFATVELAVEAMRHGAFDFVAKPFTPEVLIATAARAVEHTGLLRENGRLRDTVTRLQGSSEIVGKSAAISELRHTIALVGPAPSTVLITGETGTGKELVARAIHRSSDRAGRPLVAVNCAAFTETLLESELFGHERGAFTGADRSHEGVFEAANGGTLFLDEAGELSMGAQAKLLRVLMDRMVTRIGATKPRHVDVRLLVATHRDLKQRVREGLFREDLYYRIAVVPLAVPPLREHREDIPELCGVFLAQVAQELKTPQRRISAAAMRALMNYDFPGNVRELRNLIERACILSPGGEIAATFGLRPCAPLRPEACILSPGGEISATSFPLATDKSAHDLDATLASIDAEKVAATLPEALDLRQFLATVEKAIIRRALESSSGSQAEAARKLGLSRGDVSYKLKHRLKDTAD